MKYKNLALYIMIGVMAISMSIFLTGCGENGGGDGGDSSSYVGPTVTGTDPAADAFNVPINYVISVIFSKEMDPTTITTSTFIVENTTLGGIAVAGTVVPLGTTATFLPDDNLAPNTVYTAMIKAGARDLGLRLPLLNNYVWSFTTGTGVAEGPVPVDLGTSGNFVILSKSGISTTGATLITGDIGVSPIDHTALTGFSEAMDASGIFSTSIYVSAPGVFVPSSGKLYAADYAPPTPSNLTTAVSDMETAYTNAAGRVLPDHTELGAGEIGGLTLAPGLYKWGTDVNISTNVTLDGGANDVWIFQISGKLILANDKQVILIGGALPENIFWQAFGDVTLGTDSQFEGIILTQTLIALNTGASVNGRLLAQTAVTLGAATVTQP